MVFKRFSLMLTLRLAALFLCLAALAWILAVTDFIAAPVLLIGIAVILGAEILGYIRRTNSEITRFLDAVRHADFSQSFSMQGFGSGFAELGETLGALMERFRASRAEQETVIRYLRAVVEHVPVPLLSLAPGRRVRLLNNAARRFFSPHTVTKLDDLDRFGTELSAALTTMPAGERRLVRLTGDEDAPQRAAVSLTEIVVGDQAQRLVALQNISSELEATELSAWQQLVRVLTHEIMNSLTPVSSLAETAADLLREGEHDQDTLADAKDAVETVARRAGALMAFVQSYRQLTRLPRPKPQRISVADLFHRLETLSKAERTEGGPALSIEIVPPSLDIHADPEQVEQILINLLHNATEALEGCKNGRIRLAARLNRRGRPVIEVADNGPGVPADVADKIFVPFFTTKRGGTGVGLALTRQVMIAHKGTVSLGTSETGGAQFTLTF